MRFKRKFRRRWKSSHPKDPCGLDKDFDEVMRKIEKLDKETNTVLKKIEKNRPSKESIRIFLENM